MFWQSTLSKGNINAINAHFHQHHQMTRYSTKEFTLQKGLLLAQCVNIQALDLMFYRFISGMHTAEKNPSSVTNATMPMCHQVVCENIYSHCMLYKMNRTERTKTLMNVCWCAFSDFASWVLCHPENRNHIKKFVIFKTSQELFIWLFSIRNVISVSSVKSQVTKTFKRSETFKKSENIPKIWRLLKNLKTFQKSDFFLKKSENILKVSKFYKNLKFFQKLEIFPKIWNS